MLYRTSPTAPVFDLRREIDRLFEDPSAAARAADLRGRRPLTCRKTRTSCGSISSFRV